MDLPSLHKLFQMALETGWIAKVRDILYIVPYCHGYSCIMNERYYQIYDLLAKRTCVVNEKEYEYTNA